MATLSDSAELDNLLVAQKDAIIALINAGKLAEATATLDILAPLWEAAHYGYKTAEMRRRIADARNTRKLTTTTIKRVKGEWIVYAYDQFGERMPSLDYYTDSMDDAKQTADAMIRDA